MADKQNPKPPRHLKAPTRRWWKSVVDGYALEPHHIRLLTLAAEAWDRCQQSREALQELPSLSSAQFSQEADLNSRARFALAIERLAEEERSYHLMVFDLPEEIDASFLDRETGAELSQVKLDGETTRREVDLELRIPTKLDSQFVGTSLVFYALVTDQEGIEHLKREDELGAGAIPVARMVEAGGYSAQRLELIARGRPGLEIVVNERYLEAGSGEPVTLRIDLFNPGTLKIVEVRMDVAAPLGWECEMVPQYTCCVAARHA